MSEGNKSAFEDAANEKRMGIVGEFVGFLRDNMKLWLIPILLVMGVLGALVVLAGSGAAPFIYTLF